MRFLSYVMISVTTIWIYHMWTKLNDDQIAEYYGNVRNKYIKVMGFDYDHVKFDEIGSEMKIETDSIEDKTDEEKLRDLHDDIRGEEPPRIHEDVPEEEVAEVEHADMQAVQAPQHGQPIVPPNDPRLPKFIVIGVMKCGTGATQHFLSNHPNLRPAKQETYFFNNDHKYLGMGYEYYLNLFPQIKNPEQVNYEKTPTYYKSVRAQARIKAMNSSIQLVNIVCDNVRRMLSRFLHLQHGVAIKKFHQNKLEGIGHTLDEFNKNLKKTIKDFGNFLEDIKQAEGHGTMEGLVDALLIRLKRRMRPFGIKATKNPIELLLSDGFYAVFHKRWQEYFPEEQLKVIDGSKYLTEPWVPLRTIQEYLGVEQYITKDNFQENPDGLPCFIEHGKSDCLGSGKGRTLDKRFNKEVTKALNALFKPFDDYFAKKVLHRNSFHWNFGIENL